MVNEVSDAIDWYSHCVKNVHIRSYSGPYSVQMRKNTDQNNSEYGQFLTQCLSPKSRDITLKSSQGYLLFKIGDHIFVFMDLYGFSKLYDLTLVKSLEVKN